MAKAKEKNSEVAREGDDTSKEMWVDDIWTYSLTYSSTSN